MRLVSLIYFLVFVCLSVNGKSIEIRHNQDFLDTKPYLKMAFSKQLDVNLDTLNFKPFSLSDVKRERGAIFLKFTIDNHSENEELYLNTVYFDSVAVFVKRNKKWEKLEQQSGFLIPMQSKTIKVARTSLVPIPLNLKETSEYIVALYSATQTSALAADVSAKIGLHLYSEEGLFIFNIHKNMGFLLVGVLCFMMIINGGIYFLGRKKSYLYLVFYNFFFMLAIVSTNGLLHELGLLNSTEINRTFRLLMWNVFPIFYLLFGENYLQLKRKSRKWYLATKIILVINLISLVPFLFSNLSLVFTISPYLFPLNALVLFINALILIKGNFVPAKFMVVASLLLFLGYVFIFVGIKSDFISFVYSEIIAISFLLLELSIFSIAVFYELRYTEKKALVEMEKRLKIEKELNKKNRELISTNLKLMNNHEQLNEMIANKKINFDHLKQQINQINQSNLNWEKTFKHFQEVHPMFFEKLSEVYPKLTSNDLKICAFLKLNLSTKEIAAINSVSEIAVSKSRNRLRKKMEMPPGEDIVRFINQSIGEI